MCQLIIQHSIRYRQMTESFIKKEQKSKRAKEQGVLSGGRLF
jgi:hypothetical protein